MGDGLYRIAKQLGQSARVVNSRGKGFTLYLLPPTANFENGDDYTQACEEAGLSTGGFGGRFEDFPYDDEVEVSRERRNIKNPVDASALCTPQVNCMTLPDHSTGWGDWTAVHAKTGFSNFGSGLQPAQDPG